MSTTRILTAAALAFITLSAAACGSDSTEPGNDIVFPDWPPAVNAAFCVQGTSLVGTNKSGTLSDSDCDSAAIDPNDEGYFEIWRVRVASPLTVTFDLSSGFDNYMSVWQVNSVSSSSVNVSLLAENDDRSSSNLNAMVSVQLEPNIDYVVAVAGYDYRATGSYMLQIR